MPLPTWFMAIYLIATSSKGVSAMVISRQLGISYKTAWFLCHRIRQLLADDDSTLKGIVEVDETYIGASAVAMRRASATATMTNLKGVLAPAR